jgi:hypothetical protein
MTICFLIKFVVSWTTSVDFVTGPFRAAVDVHKRTCEWLYAAKNHQGGKTMEEKYVGIDIHRDYGMVCVQDPKGKTLDEFRFVNNIEGINKVKEKLGNNNSHIAIESTGNMWIVLWDKLEEIESVRDERETVRLRASLVRMRMQAINKIRSIFHKYCIRKIT